MQPKNGYEDDPTYNVRMLVEASMDHIEAMRFRIGFYGIFTLQFNNIGR